MLKSQASFLYVSSLVRSVSNRLLAHSILIAFVLFITCGAFANRYGAGLGISNQFHNHSGVFTIPALAQFSATALIAFLSASILLIDRTQRIEAKTYPIRYIFTRIFPWTISLSLFPLVSYYSIDEARMTASASLILSLIAGLIVGLISYSALFYLTVGIANRIAKWFKSINVSLILIAITLLSTWLLNFLPGSTLSGATFVPVVYVIAIYTALVAIRAKWRGLFLLGFLAWIAIMNRSKYKYKFPGLDYTKCSAASRNPPGETPAEGPCDREGAGIPGMNYVSPIAALEAWRKRAAAESAPKPKLVIVSTSGGAYRATFWTALVLDRLASGSKTGGDFPGLIDNIRLLTGASGGMIASGYFAAKDRADPAAGDLPCRGAGLDAAQIGLAALIECDITEAQKKQRSWKPLEQVRGPRDSLSAIAFYTVFCDLPGIVFPMGLFCSGDRGIALEQQWGTLSVSFEELSAAEREGRRPSLIISPVLIDSGRPLLISNLDLSEILPKADTTASSPIVFFDWFPQAYASFKLQTALRMNATFPLISPAVELPTRPPRRVGDAGYYDNYGITTASAYLQAPAIRKWIIENTSGVLLVQIRAYAFNDELARFGRLERAFQFATSPLEGFLATKTASMRFRNETEVRLIQDLYHRENAIKHSECLDVHAGPCKFVETVIFEFEKDGNLTWDVTDAEIADMRASLEGPENMKAITAIKNFWTQRERL